MKCNVPVYIDCHCVYIDCHCVSRGRETRLRDYSNGETRKYNLILSLSLSSRSNLLSEDVEVSTHVYSKGKTVLS